MKKEFDLEEYKRKEAERDQERRDWNTYKAVGTWRFFVTLAIVAVVLIILGFASCFPDGLTTTVVVNH